MRFSAAVLAWLAVPALAQDSAAFQSHIDNAKRIAGTQWAQAANYFCAESSMPNRPTDPAIAPTRLFDNLLVVGSVGTAVYILQTTRGLILIDAGYPEQIDSVLLPGLKALGLDPSQVRYVIVTHGHSDHFGAARYLQETYRAKVFLSKADWDLLDAPPAAGKGAPAPQPKRDEVVADLQPITLGDTSVLPVLVPGHTPGALALIFPVFDQGEKYMAGLFGGTVLSAGFVSADGLRDYIKSVQRYARIAAENHVTVEIQNHPLMDGFAARLELLKQRGVRTASSLRHNRGRLRRLSERNVGVRSGTASAEGELMRTPYVPSRFSPVSIRFAHSRLVRREAPRLQSAPRRSIRPVIGSPRSPKTGGIGSPLRPKETPAAFPSTRPDAVQQRPGTLAKTLPPEKHANPMA